MLRLIIKIILFIPQLILNIIFLIPRLVYKILINDKARIWGLGKEKEVVVKGKVVK